MRVAILSPANVLEQYSGLSTYHLTLAHLYDDPRYRKFYNDRHSRGDYIILDNGANEGVNFDDHRLVAMASEGNCAEVVAPDHPRDGFVSTNRTLAFSAQYRTMLRERGVRIMGAPQGKSLSLWLHNFHLLRHHVDTIGVSKVCEQMDEITCRLELVAMIAQYGHTIHLLGADQRLSDVFGYTKYSNVRGVDTQKPFSGGCHLIGLHEGGQKPPSINLDCDAHLGAQEEKVALANIRTYREWARDNG